MNPDGEQQIRVHFGKPFPIFPLDGVVLLPHAMVRLFIFEPRYRQMLESVLDTSGQIAMAAFDGESWTEEYAGTPPVKPAVCVGQITHHERMPDGNYRVWVQGVCRARIVDEELPEGDRLYRQAMLQPLEADDVDEPDAQMEERRERLVRLLADGPCKELPMVRALLDQTENEHSALMSLPPRVLFEIVGLSVVGQLDRKGLLYRLLAEGDPRVRADVVLGELNEVGNLIRQAEQQFDPEAPEGISWN